MPKQHTLSDVTLRAVLFDFDGTLGDSYPAIASSVNHVRFRYGLPSLTVEEVRPHVGRGPALLLERTVGRGNVEENVAAYRRHHPSVMREGTRLLPGAADALISLHRHGLRLAICSNKPVAFTRDLIAFLGVAEKFEVVLGPEDVLRPKPAPDILLAALPRLGIRSEEALYVGDMVVDIETARGAGVPVWVVPTGSDEAAVLKRGRPDRLIRDLQELARLLVPTQE